MRPRLAAFIQAAGSQIALRLVVESRIRFALSCHRPRKRAIQNHKTLRRLLDAPLSRGMTME
jgi:hypothetical protein